LGLVRVISKSALHVDINIAVSFCLCAYAFLCICGLWVFFIPVQVALSWYFHSLVVAGNSVTNSFLHLRRYKCGATSLTRELLVLDNAAACTCIISYRRDLLLWYALRSSHQIFSISRHQAFDNSFCFSVCVLLNAPNG